MTVQMDTSHQPMVVDASIGVKWVVQEEYSTKATMLLNSANRLLVPDLFFAEVGNVLWVKAKRGEFPYEDGHAFIDIVLQIDLETTSNVGLLREAYQIAAKTGQTAYDCCYLVLAIQNRCALVTADERFYNALFPLSEYRTHLKWVGDL